MFCVSLRSMLRICFDGIGIIHESVKRSGPVSGKGTLYLLLRIISSSMFIVTMTVGDLLLSLS